MPATLTFQLVLLIYGIAWRCSGESLNQANLIITSIITEPYLMLKSDESLTGNDVYEGFCKDLIDLLQLKLKFQYTIQNVNDNKYGTYHSKIVSWNGMMGELLSKDKHKADLAVAPLTITRDRAAVVDFTMPFIEFQLGILMRKPDQDTGPEPHVFIRPLTLDLWIILLATIVVLPILLFVVEKCVAIARKVPTVGYWANGVSGSPKSTAGRILQISFWAFVVIFGIAYIATFAANRVVDSLGRTDIADSLSIKNIHDLVRQSTISPGILRAGGTYDYFRFSKDPFYKELFAKILERKDSHNTVVRTMEDGFERVRNETDPFAFILEAPYAQIVNGKQPCNTILAPEFFGPKKGYGVAMRPEFKYKKEISLAILEMKENGEMEQLEQKWFTDRNECPQRSQDSNDRDVYEGGPLRLGTMVGVFYVLGAAMLGAFIIGLIEIIIAKLVNPTKRSTGGRAVEVPL